MAVTWTGGSDKGRTATLQVRDAVSARPHRWLARLIGLHQGHVWRRVLALALPVVADNLLQTLLGIVDTMLVARLGAAQLAGVGTALQSVFFLYAILSAIAVGASVLVAQAVGAGDRRRAGRLAKQALAGGVLLSAPVSVLGVMLAGPSIHLFGVSAAVAQSGILYTQITMGTSLTLIVSLVAGALLRGAGDTRSPMLVTLLSNGINALLAYGLIFGQFGLPALGVAGSAWGAVIGRGVGALLLLALLLRGRGPLSIRGRGDWRPQPRLWREVLALGLPASTEQILLTIGFVALTAVVAHLGTAALAAQRLAINVMMLSFMPGFGCSVAATTLMGQSVGAKRIRDGVAAAGIAVRLAVLWMSALGVVFAAFSGPLMRVFTSDPRVAALGAGCLLAIALAQPAWAINDVLAGALRGAGHTTYPMLVNVATFWLAVSLAFVGVQAGGTLLWTWLAFTLVTPFGAGATAWRFRRWLHQSEQRGIAGQDRDRRGAESARAA